MSRAKRTRKQPARRVSRSSARPVARPARSRRAAASARSAVRRAAASTRSAAVAPASRLSAGWATLEVVFRPALAMATLPARMYRVYRWAEAEQARAAAAV